MRVHPVPEFRLRFPLSEVQHWAARYSYADDAAVEAIGEASRARGWYKRQEFLTVTQWKTPRSKTRCAMNGKTVVKEATTAALQTTDERLRIGVLTLLQGVEMPTASVLLHLAHRDPYPIIDYRALWSLGVESPPASYSFGFWSAYTQTCRSLATEAGVSMRTLDRALWQYSKEHQPTQKVVASNAADAPAAGPSSRTAGSKSAEMRRRFEKGQSVAEVARALDVRYSFAFGVHKRWQESEKGSS